MTYVASQNGPCLDSKCMVPLSLSLQVLSTQLKCHKLFLERVIRQQDEAHACKIPAHFNVGQSDISTYEHPPDADPGMPAEHMRRVRWHQASDTNHAKNAK